MKKKICFVLFNTSAQASGGYKMVYSYANWLVERGYDVSIMFMNIASMAALPDIIRRYVVKLLTKIRPTWFPLDKRIKKISLYPDNGKRKYDFDIVIATELKTASFVADYFDETKKAYFIQDHENWGVTENTVHDTYKLDMTKIVISDWLKTIVDQYSRTPSIVIKNPLDLSVYKVIKNVENRSKFTVGMLYHANEYKGCKYAIEALNIVKAEYPQLKVKAFSTAERPDELPDWYEFKRNATQEETVQIYNEVAIWICATIEEGFGLTGLEAMACGAALVSTDYKGVHEYAIDGYNALLSPIKEPDKLAKSIIKVIENDEERVQLVKHGLETVKAFDVEMAVSKFENALFKTQGMEIE